MQIPTKLTDANIYVDGADFLGKGSLTLPEITQKTMDHDSFGIAGTVEIPLIGQIEKMEGQIRFHNLTQETAAVVFNPVKAPLLDVRSAFQYYDTESGETHVYPIKVSIKGFFKKNSFPEMKKSSDGEFEVDYGAHYLKIEIDGGEVLEIDQFNYIYRVDGVDVLAEHRAALGM